MCSVPTVPYTPRYVFSTNSALYLRYVFSTNSVLYTEVCIQYQQCPIHRGMCSVPTVPYTPRPYVCVLSIEALCLCALHRVYSALHSSVLPVQLASEKAKLDKERVVMSTAAESARSWGSIGHFLWSGKKCSHVRVGVVAFVCRHSMAFVCRPSMATLLSPLVLRRERYGTQMSFVQVISPEQCSNPPRLA